MFTKTKFFALILTFVLGLTLLAPNAVKTQDPSETDLLGLGYGEYTGLGRDDVRYTVARIINVALGLLGIVAVVLIVYAGFTWMTAGGNEEKIKSAQKTLMAAVIGLVIILSAYAITDFVVKELYTATTGEIYRE